MQGVRPGQVAEPAYVNGFVEGPDLILLRRNERGELLARRRRAEWSSFHRWADVSPENLRNFRNSPWVAGLSEEGDWLRVKWRSPEYRDAFYHARQGEQSNAEQLGLSNHFEADVDPVRRFFSETGAGVQK